MISEQWVVQYCTANKYSTRTTTSIYHNCIIARHEQCADRDHMLGLKRALLEAVTCWRLGALLEAAPPERNGGHPAAAAAGVTGGWTVKAVAVAVAAGNAEALATDAACASSPAPNSDPAGRALGHRALTSGVKYLTSSSFRSRARSMSTSSQQGESRIVGRFG